MSELLPLLIGATGLNELDLRGLISTAPSRYKHFFINKRNGSFRRISQPARELKVLQRALIDCCLANLPVHRCATAYRSGISILDNAKAHAGNGPIKKYDFRNFFPSIKAHDWQKYCSHHGILQHPDDQWASERILFQRDKGSTIMKLSIGAPSSPIVSNILMHQFDLIISEAVASQKISYTRYADDLTFSAPRTGYLNAVEPALRKAIKEVHWPSLEINDDKTVVATRKYRREVTGLILTNDGQVSLGRDKKRKIRAALQYARDGKLSQKDLSYLCGFLAFANSVEPTFTVRMELRYGSDLINYVKGFAAVARRDPPSQAD